MMMPKDRIIRAKAQLLLYEPFWGQLVAYINEIETQSIPTMGVDLAGNLYFNVKFLEGLTNKQLRLVLEHEILHVALLHPLRGKSFNKIFWNIACDLKVNSMLPEKPTKDALVPDFHGDFKFGKYTIKDIPHKSEENVYDELMKIPENQLPEVRMDIIFTGRGLNSSTSKSKKGQSSSQSIVGGELVNKTMSSQEQADLKHRWDSILQGLKTQGIMPGGIKRQLFPEGPTQINWRFFLHGRFARLYKQLSWRRPSKKLLPFYFPGKERSIGIKAVVAFDTSGSMSQEELSEALAELLGISHQFPNIHIQILACDSKIHTILNIKSLTPSKISKLDLEGGGGTDFRPVFKWVKQNVGYGIDCLIYFSDGYGSFPIQVPPYPVFWVSHSGKEKVDWPFGELLLLK